MGNTWFFFVSPRLLFRVEVLPSPRVFTSLIFHRGRPDSPRAEFRQISIDAVMLLQEMLFDLNERTLIVDAPSDAGKSSSRRKNDGNKGFVIEAARELGLSSPLQINALFAQLKPRHGCYSIHDALATIGQMQNDGEKSYSSHAGSDEAVDCEDGSILSGDDGDGAGGGCDAKPLALLGSRLRTVFEDGREYEGTITHVHYRVVYDDDETETFDSEGEICENLACNDVVLGGSSCDELRCSVLELFSGEEVAERIFAMNPYHLSFSLLRCFLLQAAVYYQICVDGKA